MQKKFNFCKFANIFADSKSGAQELSNDVSFFLFGHQTWDLEGGGQIDPPPWFSSTPAGIGLTAQWNLLVFSSDSIELMEHFESWHISLKSDHTENMRGAAARPVGS